MKRAIVLPGDQLSQWTDGHSNLQLRLGPPPPQKKNMQHKRFLSVEEPLQITLSVRMSVSTFVRTSQNIHLSYTGCSLNIVLF